MSLSRFHIGRYFEQKKELYFLCVWRRRKGVFSSGGNTKSKAMSRSVASYLENGLVKLKGVGVGEWEEMGLKNLLKAKL